MFINSKSPLPLDKASDELIISSDCTCGKTKIRRLYDIVNVFKSIKIVSKIQLTHKKSIYEWQGTTGLVELIESKKGVFPTLIHQSSPTESQNILSHNEMHSNMGELG